MAVMFANILPRQSQLEMEIRQSRFRNVIFSVHAHSDGWLQQGRNFSGWEEAQYAVEPWIFMLFLNLEKTINVAVEESSWTENRVGNDL